MADTMLCPHCNHAGAVIDGNVSKCDRCLHWMNLTEVRALCCTTKMSVQAAAPRSPARWGGLMLHDPLAGRCVTLDPCERCGAHRWEPYPPDDEGMRMICGECNAVAPMELRILVGQD